MCEPIIPPKNIKIECERDSALRLTEVGIVACARDGVERQVFSVYCGDDGLIRTGPAEHYSIIGRDLKEGVRYD